MTPPQLETAPAAEFKHKLWLNAHFLRLWLGQTVSEFGSHISKQAIPLTAVILLEATPAQMGVLSASMSLPALLISLLAGVWVDRVRRRPLLVGADIGRTILLIIIPLLAWGQILRIEYLIILSFFIGTLTILFDIAVTSFIVSLLPSAQLVEGNSKLQVSTSVASVIGPGLAAVLIDILTAPIAILVDGLSFLFSAVCVSAIKVKEQHLQKRDEQKNVLKEIRQGLYTLWNNIYLRIMTLSSGLGSLAISMQYAVLFLYIINDLELSATFIGIMLSVRGMASILGALIAGYVGRRLGPGPAVIWGTLIVSLGLALLILRFESTTLTQISLLAAQLLFGLGSPIYNVNQVSLRQAVTPNDLLGRVNASRRFIVFGLGPIGALAGGFLGTMTTLQLTLGISAILMFLGFLVVFYSPLRTLRTIPPLIQ